MASTARHGCIVCSVDTKSSGPCKSTDVPGFFRTNSSKLSLKAGPTLQLEDVADQVETKRKKKRKAKKKLNQQDEDGQSLVPLDDTEEGKEKESSPTPLGREESEC